MARFALFPVLLAAACLVAGLYGALHNQISFTVCPDYFFAFKFHQFAIPEHLQNRLGAAIVGWKASWWMGLIISVPVLLVGLIHSDWQAYLKYGSRAFAVVICTALVVGLGALAVGFFTISAAELPDGWYPGEVKDQVAFARAGTMHNASYLGGGIGIITGSIYLILARRQANRRE